MGFGIHGGPRTSPLQVLRDGCTFIIAVFFIPSSIFAVFSSCLPLDQFCQRCVFIRVLKSSVLVLLIFPIVSLIFLSSFSLGLHGNFFKFLELNFLTYLFFIFLFFIVKALGASHKFAYIIFL